MSNFFANNNIKDLRNKKVLLRLDLNVPLLGKTIANDYKLKSVLPTLRWLFSLNCSVIIVTHLGEPSVGFKEINRYSVAPLAQWLSKKLSKNIVVAPTDWKKLSKQATLLKAKQCLMLENIRCFKGELDNDDEFAKKLASLAEVYINDAFAVSHRANASVSAITKYIKSFAGPLLEREIINLNKAKNPKKPFVLIMGGAKITTKLPLLKKLAPLASAVLIGGGVANTILAARGFNVGRSLIDTKALSAAKNIFKQKIILPIDVVVGGQKPIVKKVELVKDQDIILDIGPKTIALFNKEIKKAKTIFWNGPLGAFEDKRFAVATRKIAQEISRASQHGAYSVIGGGETVSAAGKRSFSFVSTGGGASLSYLGGEKLPGLKRIVTL